MRDHLLQINQPVIMNGDMYFNDCQYDKAEECFRQAILDLYSFGTNQSDLVLVVNELRLKIKQCKWFKRDKEMVHTHLGCVLYFMQRLDIEMVADLLDDKRTYQDMNKDTFIEKLGIAFDTFRSGGDSYLNRSEGYCNSTSCHFKKNGFSLRGTKSFNFMDLIIETENNFITDIYECTEFKCRNEFPKKGRRICINVPDENDLPF